MQFKQRSTSGAQGAAERWEFLAETVVLTSTHKVLLAVDFACSQSVSMLVSI
jgi:hypothetical protein